jgi:hypothetical protein
VKPHTNTLLHEFWKPAFVSWNHGIGSGTTQIYERLRATVAGFSWLDPRLTLLILLAGGVVVAVRRPILGVAIWTSIAVAVALAALQVAPLGGGRTDIYLFPLFALMIGNGIDETARMLQRHPAAVAIAGVGCVLAAAAWLTASTQRVVPRYTLEDTRPLVHLVERSRHPGDLTLIYPSTNFAYGLYTRFPIRLVHDDRYQTSFHVQPRDPRTVVLPMARDHPDRYERALQAITAPRVWLIGSHFTPDWNVIRADLEQRGYRATQQRIASNAALILYTRLPTAPS